MRMKIGSVIPGISDKRSGGVSGGLNGGINGGLSGGIDGKH